MNKQITLSDLKEVASLAKAFLKGNAFKFNATLDSIVEAGITEELALSYMRKFVERHYDALNQQSKYSRAS